MNQYLESVKSYIFDKFNNPFLPAFTVAWAVINYPVILLIFSSLAVGDKLTLIDEHLWPGGKFDFQSGLLHPFYSAAFYAFVYPLISAGVVAYLAFINKWGAKLRFYASGDTPVDKGKLQEIIREHSSVITNYEADIAIQKRVVDDLRDRLSASEGMVSDLKTSEMKHTDSIKQLNKQLGERVNELAFFQAERESLQDSLSTLNGVRDKLIMELSTAQEKTQELQREIETQNALIDQQNKLINILKANTVVRSHNQNLTAEGNKTNLKKRPENNSGTTVSHATPPSGLARYLSELDKKKD